MIADGPGELAAAHRTYCLVMRLIEPGQIRAAVEAFLREDRTDISSARRRERSWDFCFNHFQDHPKPTNAMALSCLHLGYYLASWGMLRGSSFLFNETNVRHYQEVVRRIEQHNDAMRDLDVQHYRESETTARLEAAWKALESALLPAGGRSLTLVSKVMMGVWGCIPSYDSCFVKTFQAMAETREEKRALSRAGEASRGLLVDVYDQHQDEIDSVRQRFMTWDFATGEPTARPMTRAKMLDIYGFQQTFGG